MFKKSLYEKNISTSWLGHSLHFFEELDSTNSYAKDLSSGKSPHGAIVLADNQTGGRGQYHRKWQAEEGKNLTFSIVLTPTRKDGFTLLTLACALSVLNALNKNPGISSQIKWPNDVLINGKKVCGILTETQFVGNTLDRVVIGIGLNVNQEEFSDDLAEHATSLSLELSKKISREKLITDILKHVEERYYLWNQFNSDLPKHINERLIGYGKWIRLRVNGKMVEGKHKFLGIDRSGKMITLNKKLDVTTYAYEQVRVLL